ncbi:MAG: NifB/NifX family molybdenum-iron cluster-binding protein [Planctomycetota bacterium]
MCPPRLSSELALRVAHASKALQLETKHFTQTLIDGVGLPFSKSRFGKITAGSLSSAMEQSSNDAVRYAAGETEKVNRAVQYLWGFRDDDEQRIAQPTASLSDVTTGDVRVAVASTDGEWLDAHFGGTLRFFVYRVGTECFDLVDVRSVAGSVDAEDATEFRVGLIQDCQLLYVQSIGGPPAGKVTQRGVYPLKVEAKTPVADLIGRLQDKMRNAPPPWLAKAMGVPVEDRIRYTEGELRSEGVHHNEASA